MTVPIASSPAAPLLSPGTTELLSPARDLECGRAAINCGADAVYVGAGRFGARESAGNTLEDIAALTAFAHQYWARVYVTINTLLHDRELPAAERLAWQLYEIGADALIIQDAGLLECDLPPLPLIASTQMHNNTPEKVAFLEKVGFRRAILARELCLDELRAVRRAAPRIELESFVHGALCVCYSGQCYLSYALGGRSGNRGRCAQPCRKPYRLVDARGRVLHERSHLLSLCDLNLSEHLPELLDAGVTSFKIEGRLKDMPYVANVTAHYRARLDAAISAKNLRRSSSGTSSPGFAPDPNKTFNRGYTPYFLHGRNDAIAFPATPKMVGEEVGHVTAVHKTGITVATALALHPGDGLCFFDACGELQGTQVNGIQGPLVVVQSLEGLGAGTLLYRNHDHAFMTQIKRARMERRLGVSLALRTIPGGISLVARDEDGIEAEHHVTRNLDPAKDPTESLATIRRQLMKMGNSKYACTEVVVEVSPVPFLAVAVLNAMRRNVLDALTSARAERRPRLARGIIRNDVPYPERELSYLGNVLNKKAEAFYCRHGVTAIAPGAETGLDMHGRRVMTTRYCIKNQLALCPQAGGGAAIQEPLHLLDDQGHRLRLDFDCARCEMEIFLE